MLSARLFCTARRRAGFELGSLPPALTAMLMSFAMRANCFAMRSHRANIVCLRTSNMRPIGARILLDVARSYLTSRYRKVADVDVPGRADEPGLPTIAPCLDVAREQRRVGAQNLDAGALRRRQFAGQSRAADQRAAGLFRPRVEAERIAA